MALALVLIGAGALLLYLGSELTVRGLSRAAAGLGLRSFAVVAVLIGLDLEGLAAALTAAGRGDTEIGAGVALGSALFLVGVGLGLALVLRTGPMPAPSTAALLAPGGAVVLAALAISDRYVDRFEGLLLVIGYAGYVVLVLRERSQESRDDDAPDEVPPRLSPVPAPTAAGLALLYAGAWILVEGGARLSASTGLTAGFVGAAVLGVLTTLDQVLLQVPATRRGLPGLAAGNLLGTLTATMTLMIGLAAVVRPLVLDTGVNLAFLAVAFLYGAVAATFLLRGRAGWVFGVFLLAFSLAWLVYAAGA